MREFIAPDFLKNQSVEEIHSRMMGVLPDWMDKAENTLPYDFTIPTAIEKAQFVEFVLIEAIKNMYPQWAYSTNLDRLGELRGLYRKKATKAVGTVTITAKEGTELPVKTKFSTVSNYGEPSVEFETTETVTLGVITEVSVSAVIEGTTGNVAAGTIALLSSPVKGVSGVTNNKPVTGGTNTEIDDVFRERIVEYDLNQGNLYVGSEADYKRWTMEVDGVGSALVISASDDTGTVRIVITDSDGNPATKELCSKVYDHIMRPDFPPERKAPVNAYISVTPPTTIPVTIVAKVSIDSSVTLTEAKECFVGELKAYYKQALVEKEIKYNRIIQIIMSLKGIKDVSNVTLNGTTQNIPIDNDELPVTSESQVNFTP